jgi:hypothetical protein
MATSSTSGGDFKSYMDKLETTLDLYLVKKAPPLPTGAKEAIVKFMPWIVLILFIISLPAILFLLGLSAMLSPFMGMTGGTANIVSTIVLLIALVFEAMSIPGLMAKTKKGWQLAYYSSLLAGLSSLLNYNIVGAIIGTLISLYILFQIKSYYK